MGQISIGVAFVAGILSFLSPCVLPLIPGYISFLSGLSLEELRGGAERKKVIRKAGLGAVFFVIGFSVVFISLGASASFVGNFMASHIKFLNKIAGVLILILGLHLTGILNIGKLNVEKRFRMKHFSPGLFSAFLIGLAFAFGWTPCIGPLLAGILALAATQKTVIKGIFLLSVYSIGLGIPFIITGFSIGIFMRFFERYKRLIRFGEIIAGVFLVIIGVLIFFNNLSILLRFTPEFFYKFAK
ncbi:cytochrome c biogenesis CcdA family protein [Candidatus Omnitrophota bacterium]